MNDKIDLALKNIAEDHDLHDYKIETSNAIKGNGFLGIITAVKIIGKDKEEKSQTIKCIVKCASNSEALRNKFPIEKSFEIEILMYSSVFNILKSLEVKHIKSFSTFIPKCFATISDKYNECLIFENLRDGYELHPLGCSMNGEHVKLVLALYGRFHAISFALRDQDPAQFDEITKPMINTFLPACWKLKQSMWNMYEKAILTLDSKQDFKLIEKYKECIANMDNLYDELMNINTEKYCALLHGDAWSNNMLFAYNNTKYPEKPTDVRLLDFQMSRVGFPVTDLSNFIYCSCNKEVLDNLDDYLKNYYYKSFSDHLRKLGSDPEELYPFSILKEQWKKYAKFFLFLFPIFIELGSTNKDERPDLENLAESDSSVAHAFDMEISNVSVFNDRIRHFVMHLDENNYL